MLFVKRIMTIILIYLFVGRLLFQYLIKTEEYKINICGFNLILSLDFILKLCQTFETCTKINRSFRDNLNIKLTC